MKTMDKLITAIVAELAKLNVPVDAQGVLVHGDERGTVAPNALKKAIDKALEDNKMMIADFEIISTTMDKILDRGYEWSAKSEQETEDKPTAACLSGMAMATGLVISSLADAMVTAEIK